MKKITTTILTLFFLLISFEGRASEIICEPYYIESSNTLRAVSLFRAKYIGESAEEISSDNIKTKGNVITQSWNIFLREENKNHIYVDCVYEDGSEIAKQLPPAVNICTFTFLHKLKLSANDMKPKFACFTK